MAYKNAYPPVPPLLQKLPPLKEGQKVEIRGSEFTKPQVEIINLLLTLSLINGDWSYVPYAVFHAYLVKLADSSKNLEEYKMWFFGLVQADLFDIYDCTGRPAQIHLTEKLGEILRGVKIFYVQEVKQG